jgi:putative transposase
MPRSARQLADGYVYHVLNRGNNKRLVFHKRSDYDAFTHLLGDAKRKHPLQIYGYCLMPNHFHIILRPPKAECLSSFMRWLLTSHVRRYHGYYETSGHLWQGRYKSFIIQENRHFLTVLRYVERNPLRAHLVATGLDWPWSSLKENTSSVAKSLLDPLPMELPDNWATLVDTPLTKEEVECLRRSIVRQSPFGDTRWQRSVCLTLGLESTMRPRGRPKKGTVPFFA